MPAKDAFSQNDERTIVIRDRRKPNQYTTDNVIARDWLPILRVGDTFFFYSVYLSMANRETESSWGSLRTQAEYLQCSVDLIIRGNKLLEICELLYVETGNHRTCNEYYILDPPPLTAELKAHIYQRLAEIAASETSKNWQSWVKQVRKALDKHRSLPSIWAERRAKKGGRPVNTARAPKGAREPQAEFTENHPPQNPGCDSQPGYSCPTTRVVVAHNQGGCEPQPKQEQLTRKTNKKDKDVGSDLLLVRTRCSCLGIALTVINVLLERYSLDRILRQLEWLPFRDPRDPAAMLISAVQGDWTRPAKYDRIRAQEVWSTWMTSLGERADRAHVNDAAQIGDDAEEYPISGGVDLDEERFVLKGTELDARDVWARVLEELRMQMTRATFDTWLGGSQIGCVDDGVMTVLVRDEYAVEWLRARWGTPIQRTLTGIVGQPVNVRFAAR